MEFLDVWRILVDQGRSWDILYADLLEKYNWLLRNSSSIKETIYRDLMAQQWDHADDFELVVSIERKESRKIINTQLLVIGCNLVYNCITRWPTLSAIGVIYSIIHLNLKYHIDEDVVATLEVDLEVYSSCFLASLELHQGETDSKSKELMLIKGVKEYGEPNSWENSKGTKPLHAITKLSDI